MTANEIEEFLISVNFLIRINKSGLYAKQNFIEKFEKNFNRFIEKLISGSDISFFLNMLNNAYIKTKGEIISEKEVLNFLNEREKDILRGVRG